MDGFRTSGTIRNECSLENYHGEPCSPTLVFSCHPAVPGLSRKLDNPRHEHMAIQIQNDGASSATRLQKDTIRGLGGQMVVDPDGIYYICLRNGHFFHVESKIYT